MADRQALAGELAIARSMEVATMPVNEHEPDGRSSLWSLGVAGACGRAALAGELTEKRDLAILAGARIIGWIEALDELLEEERIPPE